MKKIDVCIIGGGISGLYTAYKLLKNNPNLKIKILEKTNYIGGRIFLHRFHEAYVLGGCGVGRSYDYNLKALLEDLNIKYQSFTTNPSYDKKINLEAKNYFQLLKNSKISEPMTFKEFALTILTPKQYQDFVLFTGYHDFENTDAHYALQHYGFQDVIPYPSDKFYLDWNLVIQKLIKIIKRKNIWTKTTAIEIKDNNIKTNHVSIKAKKIVFATTVKTLKQFYPETYELLNGQPFLRIFAKVSNNDIHNFSIVSTPLQKIIPITKDILMIAYNDNENAKKLKPYVKNKPYLENLIQTSFPNSKLKIIDLWHKYWDVGTHYISPYYPKQMLEDILHKWQHPEPNIYAVGEALSIHQGWVEGALQSVQLVIDNIE